MSSTYVEIRNAIEEMEVVDTHEHLEMEKYRTTHKLDMFTVFFKLYASCDLVSSGMPAEYLEKFKSLEISIEEKWQLFRPYWELAKNTAYCRVILISARDLYGIDDINEQTYHELDQRIKSANNPGLYKRILKDKCRIKVSMLDMLGEPHGVEKDVHNTFINRLERFHKVDRSFFLSSIRFDDFVWIMNNRFITALGKYRKREFTRLQDWEDQLGLEMASYREKGIAAIKVGLAYDRTIHFEDADHSTAAKIFSNVLSSDKDYSFSEVKALQDYMMHRVLDYANDMRMPVQIHTGLQEGNGNIITNSHPASLVNLFAKYPQINFDVFHGAYPYGLELATIVKNFRNVFVDLCWLHMISPEYSMRYLSELLDTVPSNKIFGFGGDNVAIEPVYGHLKIAKENIAKTLASKVENQLMSQEYAVKLAGMLLASNAKSFFALE